MCLHLGDFVSGLSSHGPKIIAGDFNARLHARQSGEEHVLGPGIFGRAGHVTEKGANRGLFMELCNRLTMCAANTLEPTEPEYLVTYRDLGTKVGDPLAYPFYA